MKKFLLTVLLALVLVIAATSTLAFAEEPMTPSEDQTTPEPTPAVLLDTEQFVEQLCKLNKSLALAQSDYDRGVAKADKVTFLVDQFRLAVGEDPALYRKGATADDETDPDAEPVAPSIVEERYFTRGDVSGVNIQTKLDAADTNKCIVIGAHYDAVSEGANDNACGVAALLRIAEQLARTPLTFDVYIVAFDGEEEGLAGSYCYADDQLSLPNADVMMMFNIDSVAMGKTLYLACENKHTALADLILKQDKTLVEKSYTDGVYLGYDDYGYGYDEAIQASDHTPFRLLGIPTALLFSGSYGLFGYEDDSGVMNTSNDSFEKLNSIAPDYARRIDAVCDIVCATVTSDDFVKTAQNARDELVNIRLIYNRWWPSLVVLGALVILAVVTALYHRRLQKQALLGTAEIKNNRVFDKPQSEDIFSFGDSKTGTETNKGNDPNAGNTPNTDKGDEADIDGIFTFKK